MRTTIPEVLTKVSRAKNKEERIALLREHDSNTLKTILQGAFHPDITWNLPVGIPPFRKDEAPVDFNPSRLETDTRKLVYFTPFSGQCIENKLKRESLFIDMLESLHPTESNLLIQMKDKKIECRGLTYQLVWETFPDIIPEPVKKVTKKVADEQEA